MMIFAATAREKRDSDGLDKRKQNDTRTVRKRTVQNSGRKPFPTVHEGYISGDGVWVSYGFKRAPGEVTHWTAMPEYPGDDEVDNDT